MSQIWGEQIELWVIVDKTLQASTILVIWPIKLREALLDLKTHQGAKINILYNVLDQN